MKGTQLPVKGGLAPSRQSINGGIWAAGNLPHIAGTTKDSLAMSIWAPIMSGNLSKDSKARAEPSSFMVGSTTYCE